MQVWYVTTFNKSLFSGNPAAVVLLDQLMQPSWCQNMALELNQAITVFLLQSTSNQYEISFYTPHRRVALCGHGTLSSAHVLYSEDIVSKKDVIFFYTNNSRLGAEFDEGEVRIEFPELPYSFDVDKQLNLTPFKLGNIKACLQNGKSLLIEVENKEILQSLEAKPKVLSNMGLDSMFVTTISEDHGVDFYSRCFFSDENSPEDAVTGSAHCSIASYWKSHLGKSTFVAQQISRRGGVLSIKIENKRVYIKGSARTILRGVLNV